MGSVQPALSPLPFRWRPFGGAKDPSGGAKAPLRVGLKGVLALWVMLPIAVSAQTEMPETGSSSTVVTRHEIDTNGGTLRYTATAGFLPIADGDGEPKARVFFVAYNAEPEGGPPRPITFAFNGGPGQPAVWLHLGVGPWRADVARPGDRPGSGPRGEPAPRLVENPHTWLAYSDLVFVDPVSTGYSRAAKGEDSSQFHGYVRDVEYLGEFVRLYLARFQRWDSPKLLVGESYGTTRVAGLTEYLQTRHGIDVDGVILVSAILNWQTARFHVGNDLPYLLFLPTYAATAWYHGMLDGELQARPLEDVVDQARELALGDYAVALLRGHDLSQEKRRDVVQRLARLTGLSPVYLDRANMRIDGRRFAKQVRRVDRVTVGRLDSRYTGVDRDAAGETPEFDPSYFVYGAFSALFNDYVRADLGFRSDLAYEVRAGDLVRPWDYSSVQNRYLNVAEDLRSAMSRNPDLRLFVASGYYDLATPFFAMDYTLSQMQLAGSQRANVWKRYYEAGHMMYIDPGSLGALAADIGAFYRAVTGSAGGR